MEKNRHAAHDANRRAVCDGSGRVLYYHARIHGQVSRGDKLRFGIYISDDGGLHWRFPSDAHTYRFVHVRGGTIYAIGRVQRRDDDGKQYHRTGLLKSEDDGKTWQDITGPIGRGVELHGIFDDPDNPKSVCLLANGGRSYVRHGAVGARDWTRVAHADWVARHETDESFLMPEYSTAGHLPILKATLSNYFLHDFGKYQFGRRAYGHRVQLPEFELTTDKTSYRFAADQPKPVTVTIKLRVPDSEETLVDMADGIECWPLRVIRPDGSRIRLPQTKKFRRRSEQGKYRSRSDFKTFKVSSKALYRRTIDLNRYAGFQKPGLYQVQFRYWNGRIADKDLKEWDGSFCGSRFEVTIR